MPTYRKPGLALAGRFLLATFICGLTAAPVAFYGVKAKSLPHIHDISTDLVNPPEFVAVPPLRKDAKNPAQFDPKVAALQLAAYPDILPIHLSMPPTLDFKLAEKVAKDMQWDIVATEPNALRIEATATTLLFGFKDDIVIRVSADGAKSRLDVRSVSRIGVSDIGTNAARIRATLALLSIDGRQFFVMCQNHFFHVKMTHVTSSMTRQQLCANF